jgi:hypothetical protein
VPSLCFFVLAQWRKKDITWKGMINGIVTSTGNSKEMTAKVRAAT